MDFDINKYAKLARIDLSDEESAKFQKDLEKILAHVDQLKEVDVSGVEPMTGGTQEKNIFREDTQEERDVFTNQFPKTHKGYLKVPKILDREND